MKRWVSKATGYEHNLYSIPSRADPARRQVIETHYMKPLDGVAARALDHIEAKGSKLMPQKLRDGWAAFILSLLHRSPRAVAHLRERVKEIEPSRKSDWEKEYQAQRSPEDPSDLESFLDQADAPFWDETWAWLFLRVLRSKLLANHIVDMDWHVIISERELIIGDDPLLRSNGLTNEDSFIAFPIGPQKYFVALNSLSAADYLAREAKAGRLANAWNRAQAEQAVERVFSRSNRYKLFLRRNLGRKSSEPNGLTWKLSA